MFGVEDDASIEELNKIVEIKVWPENQESLQVFLRLGDKRVATMVGEAYYEHLPPEIESHFRLMGLPECKWQELYSSIQIMENISVPIMNSSLRANK